MIGKLTRTIVRTFAFALALCATTSAWAADSLEETGGFVSSSSTLAFKGVSLSELTADTLSGRFGGAGAGTASGTFATFNNFDRSSEDSGSISCEAQVADDGWIKGVILTFTQSGEDVYVVKTAGKYKSGSAVGPSVSDGTSENSSYPYAIYNLALPRTGYGAATVIWEAGQFGVLSKTGSDGNTYTLNLNSNSNGSGEAITIDQSLGATIDFSSAFAADDGGTVLIRYSNLPLDTTQRAIVTTKCGSNNDRTGVWINTDATAGKTGGVWGGADYNSTGNTRTTLGSNKSAGVMAFTYHHTDGSYLYYLANGVKTTQHGDSGLKGKNDTISGIAIGGTRATSTTGTAATGMKITGIAIFKGVLTESQMNSFVWPSAVARNYTRWSYAGTANVWTYATPSSVSGDEGIANNNVKYYVFDMSSGADTAQNYTGGNTANNLAYWTYFAYSTAIAEANRKYTAPGRVLRFVASDSYRKANINGKFSPFTLGGIIVEENATGYSIQYTTGDSGTLRTMALGDPTGTAETWFEFNEDFTINRTDKNALMGTLNFDIASGKTLTFGKNLELAETWTANSTGGNGYPTIATAGGTLKLHGGGKMTINGGNGTLTAQGSTLDYTDLAATVSSSSDAYIQGTLTVNSSTVIALPAGATFPYFVASAASGTLDPANGVTIGGVAAPGYKLKSDGSVVAPRTVTISGNETWGTGTLNGWPTDDSTEGYAITVTADATLTLPSAVSCDVLSITVEDGVTLTISGNTITAADCFYLTGTGTVKVGAGNTFIGTVKGDGNLAYPDNTIPTASTAVFTSLDWSGTLILSSIQGSSSGQPGWYAPFHNYGNTNSTIKVAGFTGFFAAGNQETAATLEIAAGTTFTLNNGNNGNSMTFGKLTGSGDIVICGDNGPAIQYVMRDASEFAGSITVSQSGSSVFKKSIVLGGGSSYDYNTSNYQKQICVLGDVKIAAGKTWTADSGIVNNGTITLNGSLSGTVTGSGTVECGQGVDLTGSGFSDSANWTGTVRLNGDATPMPTTLYDETSYGNASSTLEIASGSVAITEATTLPGTVNVASSSSLFVTSSATELTLAGSNSGTINLSMASALKTLNLNLTGNGTISYPASLTTLNVRYNESLADDGVKEITATGTALTDGTMTLVRPDGTEESVTGTVSSNKIIFEWTPTVSGAACWIAYEMDYEKDNSSKTGFENSGSDNTGLTPDSNIEGSDAFTDDGMLYTYAHPWRDITYPTDGNWTAVVRCTVPAYENAAVITFGTRSSGLIGLVAGANPETQMRLVQTTGDSHFVTNATMTVQNATTAQHVYIFSVENNQTVKVYCDGDQVLNKTFDSQFTIGGGIQVGSVHGGKGLTGIVRFAKDESPASTLSETVQKAARIDCVRLYKTALGPNAIAQLSVEFPAVKLYRATVAADATTTWDALTWSPTWDGGNEYSKIILTTEGDATLTLPDSITADEFTINVASDSTLTLAKAAGGTTMTVSKLEIDDGTVAVADANFFGSHAINGTGTLKITGNGVLTSALSGNAKVEIPSGVGVDVMSGGSIANAITGAGELAYLTPADVPATSLTFSAWTGTVALPAITSGASGLNLNNYGVNGSTVSIAGISSGAWLVNEVVAPTVEITGDMTLSAFSATFANTFNKLSGSRAFSLTADGTADDYADGYFLIKDVSEFTGSITVAAPGLALGGTSKPSSTEWYGKIVVQAPVTVGSGATWSARGVVLSATTATLTVPDGATVPTVTSGVAGYEVKTETVGDNTVYSLLKRGTIFSVW